ncbi:ATP-grasp domain-containing protein [candidate division NPL-UPA2 bacterium]|nr:ATP-grasp domain-containing protein [candidate division NPL-UPA2 bacterium]
MKVLVTGAGALLGQGIIKSLRMAATNYEIVAVDPDPRAVGLYWADTAYIVPLAKESNYVKRVRKILEKERPEAVVIGTDVELMIFGQHKEDFESNYNTHVIVSPAEVIKITEDKWLTYQFLSSNGFPCPRSALPENVLDLLSDCDFPLIVKPRSGARSIGLYKVNNEQELNNVIGMMQQPVIQEEVSSPDQEYTSGITIIDGDIKAIVTMRRDLRDGNTYRAYVEPDLSFNPFLSEVAKRLGGFGPLNFQFRTDAGVPKIFEINARFSGTTPLRALAGYNEVDVILRHIVNGDEIPEVQLKPWIVLRYWNEILIDNDQLAKLQDDRFSSSMQFKSGVQL